MIIGHEVNGMHIDYSYIKTLYMYNEKSGCDHISSGSQEAASEVLDLDTVHMDFFYGQLLRASGNPMAVCSK